MEALVVPNPTGFAFDIGLSGPFVPSDYSGGPAAASGTVVGKGIVGGYEKTYHTPDFSRSLDIVLQRFASPSDAQLWFKASEAGGPAIEPSAGEHPLLEPLATVPGAVQLFPTHDDGNGYRDYIVLATKADETIYIDYDVETVGPVSQIMTSSEANVSTWTQQQYGRL
jgi:hypothetical protein